MNPAMHMGPPIPNDVYQFATYAALKAGFSRGQPHVADLASHGTDGIGACEHGLLLTLNDRQAYLIQEDGTAILAPPHISLPFAMITIFRPLLTLKLHIKNMEYLIELLSAKKLEMSVSPVGGINSLMPIQIQARFTTITLGRHKTDSEAYERIHVNGTIIGFLVPPWMESISGPRIHCHFLSDDGNGGGETRFGGHVLDFETDGDALVSLSRCGRFHLGFPQGPDWDGTDFLGLK